MFIAVLDHFILIWMGFLLSCALTGGRFPAGCDVPRYKPAPAANQLVKSLFPGYALRLR